MYAADDDVYCYPGTGVLKNLPNLRSQVRLDRFEAAATGRRFIEPMPAGRWTLTHFRRVHHHIFQDIYPWAGRFRTVRLGKARSLFCYPEYISVELKRIFRELREADYLRSRNASDFSRASAHFLAELNAVHAFRDGNGRAQLAFMALLAAQAGHPLELERLNPTAFLAAMIASFRGREDALADQLLGLISDADR